MKRVFFALFTLSALAACQNEEPTVAPNTHSSARTGAVSAGPIPTGTGTQLMNPWTNSGIPMPNLPLDRMMPWPQATPDSVTYVVTMRRDQWYKEFGHEVVLPAKIYFNGVYKGTIYGFGEGVVKGEQPYPASRAFAIRVPFNTLSITGILDNKGYYYEMYKTHPSGSTSRVSTYDIAPNTYYWKLKYVPQ